MKFKEIPGTKGKYDKILLVKTDDWEKLRYEDLYSIILRLAVNEEMIYPSREGYKGRKMLRKFIYLATEGQELTDNIREYFKL